MQVIIRRETDKNNSPYYRAYKVVANGLQDLYIGGMFQSEVARNVKADLGNVKISYQM